MKRDELIKQVKEKYASIVSSTFMTQRQESQRKLIMKNCFSL